MARGSPRRPTSTSLAAPPSRSGRGPPRAEASMSASFRGDPLPLQRRLPLRRLLGVGKLRMCISLSSAACAPAAPVSRRGGAIGPSIGAAGGSETPSTGTTEAHWYHLHAQLQHTRLRWQLLVSHCLGTVHTPVWPSSLGAVGGSEGHFHHAGTTGTTYDLSTSLPGLTAGPTSTHACTRTHTRTHARALEPVACVAPCMRRIACTTAQPAHHL
jgi:hypothetical protein